MSASLFGFSVGNVLLLQPIILADVFGVRDYPRIFATSQLLSGRRRRRRPAAARPPARPHRRLPRAVPRRRGRVPGRVGGGVDGGCLQSDLTTYSDIVVERSFSRSRQATTFAIISSRLARTRSGSPPPLKNRSGSATWRGRRPRLLDDAVDDRRVERQRLHDAVAHVAGAGLQPARHRRLHLVPVVQPLRLGERLGAVDGGDGDDAGDRSPSAQSRVGVVLVERLDDEVLGDVEVGSRGRAGRRW